jgi:hypothetical protein
VRIRTERRSRLINIKVMITLVTATLAYLRGYLVSHHNLALEATALRQQLSVYKRKHCFNRPSRPEWRLCVLFFLIAMPGAFASPATNPNLLAIVVLK